MENTPNFIFPVIPSPYDDRDFIYEKLKEKGDQDIIIQKKHKNKSKNKNKISQKTINLVVRELSDDNMKLPESLDLRSYLLEPRNQGRRGTCCAFACSAIKEYQERFDVDFKDYMSPNSLYFYRKPDSGMYCRNAMKLLLDKGIAPEYYFPYNGSVEPDKIPDKAKLSMPDYKIKHYAKVSTIEGLKEALFRYGPCLIAFPVYKSTGEIWKSDAENNELQGGHAMTVVGYNQSGFIIRNSWGARWNVDGHAIYKYSDWGTHWEVWTCIDADSKYRVVPSVRSVFEKFINLICCK